MYSLSNCVEYSGQQISESSVVLLWSKKNGYFFSKYIDMISSDKLIAIHK